jgi:lipid-A-disaccharide synthase
MDNYCLVVAGEKSGEEHFLSFMDDLKQNIKGDVKFFGVGGDILKDQGMELVYHLRDFSSMGFSTDVLKKIPYYYKAMDHLVDLCKKRNVQTAILIDFQGFNMKLASKLEALGINVMYYVAPQAWVWKEKRVNILKRVAHTLFCIVPFEKKWFKDRGVSQAVSVSHPVWYKNKSITHDIHRNVKKTNEKIKILLLPGSRNSEVEHLLGVFTQALDLIKNKTDIHVSLTKTNSVDDKFYDYYKDKIDCTYTSEELAQAMIEADYCFAASGTVTLQCGVFKLPSLVAYKVSLLNEFVIRSLMKYKGFASLTNLILDEEVYPELMQESVTPEKIVKTFYDWLKSETKQTYMLERLNFLEKEISKNDVIVGEYIANIINKEER